MSVANLKPNLKVCRVKRWFSFALIACLGLALHLFSFESPRIEALQQEIAIDKAAALDKFCAELVKSGGVLIEETRECPQQALITFVWQGPQVPFLYSDLVYGFEEMQPLSGVPLSILTRRAPKDLRTLYQFYPLPGPPKAGNLLVHDRQNPHVFSYPPGTFIDEEDDSQNACTLLASELVLPNARPQPWIAERSQVPKGKLYPYAFCSATMGGQRPLWVYLPADFQPRGTDYKLVILFDGRSYLEVMHAATTLDNLLYDKQIAPTIVVFIESRDIEQRNLELPCYPPFVSFLSDELLPWIRDHYPVSKKASDVTVGGFSYGGLAALFAGSQRPDLFGNVLSQSGSFWWKPDEAIHPAWLVHYLTHKPRLPLRIYLDAGKLEDQQIDEYPSILHVNRLLRERLLQKGYPLCYQEFGGGHDFFNWQGTLADGLIFLLQNGVQSVSHVVEVGM